MSVVDQIKNMLAKKAPDLDEDSGLSLGMPGSRLDPGATQQMSGDPAESVAMSPARAKPTANTVAASTQEADELIDIPFLGKKTSAQHQRFLLIVWGAALASLVIVILFVMSEVSRVTHQLTATGQSLMQSQRLAKSVSQVMAGDVQSFADVTASSTGLIKMVRGLQAGDDELDLDALDANYQPTLDKVVPLFGRVEKNSGVLQAQQQAVTQAVLAVGVIKQQTTEMLPIAEAVSSVKAQQGAAASDVLAAGQLPMLTLRLAKLAGEFLTPAGLTAEAAAKFDQDLGTYGDIAKGLLDGNAELRLSATRDSQTRDRILALIKLQESLRTQAGVISGNIAPLVSARDAHVAIVADSEPLRRGLEELQSQLSAKPVLGPIEITLLVVTSWVALWCALGYYRVQQLGSGLRQNVADAQRASAVRQEQEAKRVNDANQAAILRLMNELQTVAEGDLTQEATVTEDITGAIADSVNYTVEELRSLVGNVQNTATRVAQTTADVDTTSTELLAASNEQLHEIRQTGQSVVEMAGRIIEVSVQAQESASVAKQSLEAADVGLKAVQNAIGGMNSIRDQIQETSKRIKRLGESSQEIGEITELISDITEQTNVLALNAAIQAASAGEAGRGFSVVAEEVQRLAERSADATRQIAALVKAIQTDTQDAVGAMERSTRGVVEGAKLSDNAGTALTEIDRVSRRLAELIDKISTSTTREANLANEVAENIQHIFAVTEQTGEGTRSTAAQVRELSKMAQELRQSVARFKIA